MAPLQPNPEKPIQTGANFEPRSGSFGGESIPDTSEFENNLSVHEKQQAHQVESTPAPVVSMPVLPAPVPTQAATDDATTTTTDDSPVAANDDELIEKEWVDKAKQIIVDTKDDPYKREQAIKRLQIDYVRKRYGRIIGDTNDNEAG